MGYNTPSAVINRANSALLRIERVISDRSIPSDVRMVMVARVMADEPVLTDPQALNARLRADIIGIPA